MFLLINKPSNWTSFDAVNFIRKRLRQLHPELKNIKVGHAGTLDPFATGLLIIGIGRESTKKLDNFKALPKTYVATLRLGAVSDTYDRTGHVTHSTYHVTNSETVSNETMEQSSNLTAPNEEEIELCLNSFLGKNQQVPPMFSAKKINGQRLYKLARQGKEVERQPAEIDINDVKLLGYDWPKLRIEVQCSAGTYIRSLAHDIGQKLGCGAYCEELARTRIGDNKIEEALNLDDLAALDVKLNLCYLNINNLINKNF